MQLSNALAEDYGIAKFQKEEDAESGESRERRPNVVSWPRMPEDACRTGPA